MAVHFCEAPEIDSIIDALCAKNIAVFSIDGSPINGIGDLYRAFNRPEDAKGLVWT